jgi:phosphopantothenoylcysteine decarboxylase/phosphopantothenate--cysteine ligase
MKVLVTCGPSWEPIDGARRLTNMSTGRLGADLAGFFAAAGCDVHCLRGSGATCPTIPSGCVMEPFDTNEDLAARLRRLGSTARFDAVFHAAALCDYRVVRVADASGRDVRSEKIATRDGRLILELEPAAKVLPSLRGWFPGARIVGWKYELAGTRADAFGRAWRQVRSGDADATVLNGVAYGEGFAICHAGGEVRECPTAALLGHALLDWLARDGAACGRRAIGTSHAIMPARREGGSL